MKQLLSTPLPHPPYTPLRQKILRTAVLTVVLAAALCGTLLPPVIHYGRKQEALAMLGRAKNVEFSMRLAAIEEYGDNLRISAPQEIAGMTEEARERIAQMAGADGQILLLAWSEEKMRPVAFLYTEGTYTVRFTYDPDTESTAWQVYRANRVLEFGQPGA